MAKPRGQHKQNRLTAISVRRLPDGRHNDGRGLQLLVEGGSRRWLLRVMVRGRRRDVGLGSAWDVPLAEAREKARELRKVAKAGGDPIQERRRALGVPDFGTFADAYVEEHKKGWRNEKHRQQWTNTLATLAAPIRDKRLNEIDTESVLSVLRPIWDKTPETAQRLRGRLEAVLDAARAKGYREGENPARWGHLKHLLSKPRKLTRGHHRALPYERVPELMRALRADPEPASRLLEFVVLTAARSNEARGAKLPEFDIGKAAWTVPADRMKSKREHRVPLTPRAVALVKAGAQEGYVFRGRKGGQFSDAAMGKVLDRIGFGDLATAHGMRATFRTWVQDCTSFPGDLAEAALAHVIRDKTQAAYARGELFDKRRKMMEAWADYCAGSAKVIKLAGRGR